MDLKQELENKELHVFMPSINDLFDIKMQSNGYFVVSKTNMVWLKWCIIIHGIYGILGFLEWFWFGGYSYGLSYGLLARADRKQCQKIMWRKIPIIYWSFALQKGKSTRKNIMILSKNYDDIIKKLWFHSFINILNSKLGVPPRPWLFFYTSIFHYSRKWYLKAVTTKNYL